MTSQGLRYKRLLLKLSGEALMGKRQHGMDMSVLERLAADVGSAQRAGCQMSVVVGGGNILRGMEFAQKGMDRATADYMGMLATVMNALAFQNVLEAQGTPARVLSAMKAAEAAKVMAYLSDTEVEQILRAVRPRQAADFLTNLPKERAANLSRRLMAPKEGGP